MNRRDYYRARAAYRRAAFEDRAQEREANRALEEFKSYGFRGFGGNPAYVSVIDRQVQALAPLSDREKAAVLAAPMLPQGRLPMGPKASAIYYRGRMSLNKRVALRRALREIDEKFGRTA